MGLCRLCFTLSCIAIPMAVKMGRTEQTEGRTYGFTHISSEIDAGGNNMAYT